MRYTDTRDDEKERGITIKSTAISMYFQMEKEDLESISQNTKGQSSQIDLESFAQNWYRQRVLDQLD